MVASGKDGSGKSAFSALLAEEYALSGKSALVIELCHGMRSLDIFMGVFGKTVYDIFDVLNGRCEPAKAIVESPICKDLYVMPAPYNESTLVSGQFVKLCMVLSENVDHVIIDTGCSDDTLLAAACAAMRAIVVTTADPSGIRDARVCADRLFDMNVPKIRLLINRLNASLVENGIIPDLDFCIDNVGAQLVGVIPETDEIALSLAKGEALGKSSKSHIIFQNIISRLEGDDVPLYIQ